MLEHPLRFAWFSLEHHNWAWWLNMLQLIGALVFFVACAVGMLLPVHLKFDETGWYWMPQMVGAVFFLASSVMAMLEVQDAPWKPAWNKIGIAVAAWAGEYPSVRNALNSITAVAFVGPSITKRELAKNGPTTDASEEQKIPNCTGNPARSA
jgi:hypothetical protein